MNGARALRGAPGVTWRAALALLLGLAGACTRPTPPAEDCLLRAAAWLWRAQRPDGSWRSDRYAVLRSGQALTPFVLETLLRIDRERVARPAGGVERALAFLRGLVSEAGAIGYSDPDLLEYPVYATSLAIRCFVAAGDPDDRPRIERMARWLAAQQYDEAEGFAPSAVAYGGFGFGALGLPSGDAGYMDLAHTREALEALRCAGALDASTGERAARFLALLQKRPSEQERQPRIEEILLELAADGAADDGGFYFSPVVHGANKGRVAVARDGTAFFRSYATATCEGVLALVALGVPAGDARMVAARHWLAARPALDRPSGIPAEHPDPWGEALFFYHLAVRAAAQRALGFPAERAAAIARELAAVQGDDGGFANARSVLMKEDEPVLATALAVRALADVTR